MGVEHREPRCALFALVAWQSGVEYTVGATLRYGGFVARCQLRRCIAANIAKLPELTSGQK